MFILIIPLGSFPERTAWVADPDSPIFGSPEIGKNKKAVAGRPGFEPEFHASKACVLPLDDLPRIPFRLRTGSDGSDGRGWAQTTSRFRYAARESV